MTLKKNKTKIISLAFIALITTLIFVGFAMPVIATNNSPKLDVSPTTITHSLRQGTGWTTIGERINITNPGGETLKWSTVIAPDDRSWLKVIPSRGTITNNGTSNVFVWANTIGLSAGIHTGYITFIGATPATGSPDIITVRLVVTPPPLTGINVIPETAEVVAGATQQFTAEAIPAGAILGDVTWSVINDTGSGTMDANGLFTAVATGEVTVTATYGGFSDTAIITVTAIPIVRGGVPVGDTTAPVISNINIQVNRTTAEITWKTNESSISWITYGETIDNREEIKTTTYTTSHSIVLTNLSPGVVYYFQIKSKDLVGNIGSYTDKTFTTLSERIIGDTNDDGKVDEYDFALMMADWGKTDLNILSDLNKDEIVDKYDFALLMFNWTK